MDIKDLDSVSLSAIRSAKGGELRPLIKLLRSGGALDQRLRDYIADQIEEPAGKRFRREGRANIAQPRNDRTMLSRVHLAKFNIAAAALGLTDNQSDEEWVDAGVNERLETVTDAEAIRYILQECGIEIPDGELNNVRNRNPRGMFNRRSWRRRKL